MQSLIKSNHNKSIRSLSNTLRPTYIDSDSFTTRASPMMSVDEDNQAPSEEVVEKQNKEEHEVIGPKKGIQWHSRNSIEVIKRIPRVSQAYSTDEIFAVWGNSDEATLRKQELKVAARDVEYGRRKSDNMTFSTVGIRDKVGAGHMEKQEARFKAWDAVMDEQDLQASEGLGRDSMLIAGMYSMTTADTREKARLEALQMEEEVRKN
jgi:hypothetical protein